MSNPLVSVLMTSYNREKFIGEAIESVLKSTYKNFELLIVDDCSKDSTVEIAEKYASSDNRIKVFINKENLGDYPNRNHAASLANGQFIMFVDSDDTINEDALDFLIGEFERIPDANFSMIYYHSDIIETTLIKGEEILRKHFLERWCLNVGPGGTFIRKNFFDKIGGYDTDFGPANDMFFNLKVPVFSSVLLHTNQYLNYRRHAGQEINNKFKYLCFNHLYLKKAFQKFNFPFSPEEKKSILKKSARNNFKAILRYVRNTGELQKAYIAFKKSGIRLTELI